MDVRLKIKAIIEDRASSRSEIARRSGMKQQAFSSVLLCKRNLSAVEFLNVCKALNMTAEEVANYSSNSAN